MCNLGVPELIKNLMEVALSIFTLSAISPVLFGSLGHPVQFSG
jgi:hypothetical protein